MPSHNRTRTTLTAIAAMVALTVMSWMVTFNSKSHTKTTSDRGQNKSIPGTPTDLSSQKSRSTYEALRSKSTSRTLETLSAKRDAWKNNFPWTATTDPKVLCDQAFLDAYKSGLHHPVIANHGFLMAFFENEARFSPQFEHLHRILDEHNRAKNPVVAGQIFQNLWSYHQASKHNPNEVQMHSPNPWSPQKPIINRITRRPIKWGERVELLKDSILNTLAAPQNWPDVPALSEEEGYEMLDEILNTIDGMDQIPDPNFAYSADYEEELNLGDSPLVPYVGWQAAYDQWEKERNQPPFSPQPQLGGIGPNNQLLDQNGNPLIAQEGVPVQATLITPGGHQVPLNRGEHGELVLPTPDEIREMPHIVEEIGGQ